MKKCDFCTRSDSNGNCTITIFTITGYSKEHYCKEAIKKMMECMKKKQK